VRWQALGERGLADPDDNDDDAAPPSVRGDFVTKLIREDVPFSKARQLAALDFERRYVKAVLDKYAGNVTKAARASGIGRRYFHMLLAKIDDGGTP